MRYEINSVASQNQASHLLITLLDVMERAGRAPTLLESLEVLFTAHWRALDRRLPFLVGHSPIALDGALFESCMSDALPSWRHPGGASISYLFLRKWRNEVPEKQLDSDCP